MDAKIDVPRWENGENREIVLVSSRWSKDNVMCCEWHTQVSYVPERYGIFISKRRFTHDLIKESGVFAVNFLPHKYSDKVLECGRCTGRDVGDKFASVGLGKEEAETINCPVVEESSFYLECKVWKTVDVGSHTLFVGDILKKVRR